MPTVTRVVGLILIAVALIYGGAFVINQMGKPEPTEIRTKVPHDRFDK